VRIGASTDLKMMNSKTMMNRSESNWVWLPALLDASWFATFVATEPARCTERSDGSADLSMAPFRSSISVFAPVWSKGETLETTSSWAALPSGEAPRNVTASTVGTVLSSDDRLVSAAWSDAPRAAPLVAATTWTWLLFVEPMSGWASVAAWLLGALAGRKALLLLFTSEPMDGRKCTAAMVPTSHTASTTHRNRTTPRPRAS